MNNPNFFLTRAIRVRNVIDHTTKALTTEQYLSAMGDDSMMFEAVTLEELEATHLYDLESDHQMMMEAITTTKNRIERTMAAFAQELNKMLNGTGMEALVAEIGQPRKAGQVAVMMARIPLSDEQSIAVVFHSPTNDPGKITETDELVAFRFLLNKRDVTHVVAPSGGRDISLKQTCLTLANLAERNSAKFQSKQAETKAKEAELTTVQSATEALETETADAVEKADTMAASLDAAKKAEEKAAAQLNKQVNRNDELRKKLAALGGTAMPGNTSDEQQEPKIKLRLHWDNKSAAAMDHRATKTLTGTGWKLVDESPYIFLTSSAHTASGFSSAAEAEQWAKNHPQSGAARSANRRKGEAIMANLQSLAGSNKGYDQTVFLANPDSKEKTKADKDAMAALLMDVVYSVTTSGWDTGIYLRSDYYLPYMVAHYFGLSMREAGDVVNWMPIRTKESGPVKFDGAKLLDGSYPKDKLIAALAALGGHYAEPGTPPAVTEPLSLTDELTALEQKADLTLPEIETFEARVDALFNSAQLPLTEWGAINTRVKKLRAGLQPPIDTIRTVKQELSIYGRFALSNGAVIAKVMREEAGDLEGYVTITEKDGTGYVLKAKSSQGASMEDAAKALYRAYREGKAEKYKGSLPAIEPAPGADPKTEQPVSQVTFAEAVANRAATAEYMDAYRENAGGNEKLAQYMAYSGSVEPDTAYESAKDLYLTELFALPRSEDVALTVYDQFADFQNGSQTQDRMIRYFIGLQAKLEQRMKNGVIDKANGAVEQDKQAQIAKLEAERVDLEDMIGRTKAGTEADKRRLSRMAKIGDELARLKALPLGEYDKAADLPDDRYWYGLRARPMGLNAQPTGHAEFIEPEQVASDPRLSSLVAGRDPRDTRWGVVGYATSLTAEQVSQYELVDLNAAPAPVWNEQTRADKFAELRTLIQAKFETDMDGVEIWQAVMTPNSPSVAENPFFVGGTHQGAELTKAFQEAGYSGTVRSMFNALADQVWAAVEQANKTPEEIEAERKDKALKASIANLTELTKGARLPQGWSLSVDPEFGELGAVSIGTPFLPNDDEHDGFWLAPEVNEAGELSGTYQLATGNGDPITTGITGWKEAKQQMIDSYQKDVDSNQPAPEPEPAPAPTGENQWGETDPEVVALLEQLEALRTTETNAGAYLAKLQEVAAKLEESGAIARHEPYLHTVSDRLTELMEAEGV